MPLKFKFKTKDEIPADHLPLYAERDGVDRSSGPVVFALKEVVIEVRPVAAEEGHRWRPRRRGSFLSDVLFQMFA